MTALEPSKPATLAIGGSGVDGLEDVDAGDILTPIIKIDHDDHVFVSSLDNRRFASFKCIPLGLIKQRILWPATPGGDGDPPLCRSYNHDEGHPDQEKFHIVTKGASGFSLARVTEAVDNPLPCADCKLQAWDSHPTSETSWCSEQFTIPMLVVDGNDDGDEQLMPAMMSFQKSAIKPVRAFLSGFIGRKRPLFTNYTTLSLKTLTGKGVYDVPKFEVGDETDPAKWREFSEYFYTVRGLLTTPRVRRDEETTDTPVASPSRPVKAAAAEVATEVMADTGAGGAKRPTPAKAAPDYDDEEPF